MSRVVAAIKRRLLKRQRGFTLIELMSVMAILSVLSAVTFPAISGSVTAGRATTQSVDIATVQRSADLFKSQAVTRYPSAASPAGVDDSWQAGGLPPSAPAGGDGTAPDSPIVFTQDAIAAVDFDASVTLAEAHKRFSRDYLRSLPDHSQSVVDVAAGADSPVFLIRRRGKDLYVMLRNATNASISFSRWGFDRNAEVWIFVDQDSY